MFIKNLPYQGIFMACLLLVTVSEQAYASANWNENAINQLQKEVGAAVSGLPESQRMALLEFYKSPTVVLLWSDQNGRLAHASELRQLLQQSMLHGLDPAPYRLPEIEAYWGKNDIPSAVTLELLLSQALLTYANDLYSGRYAPHDVDKEWHMKPRVLDNSKLLQDVTAQSPLTDMLSALAPSHDIYRALQKRLAEYRQLAEQGGWPIIAAGPTLRPGMQHEQVRQIRQRLSVTGDLQDAGKMDSPAYDEALVAAVRQYQQRNGLHADGKIGNGTRAAMNIPVEQRLIQIRINLERWRWLPLEFKGHYLLVNMTGYMLYGVQDSDIVMEMPVIIGKKYRSTPSFNDRMSYIELNPYWNVPTSIAVKDLIPAQKRDPGYMKKKNIHVFRGWKKDAEELDPATVDWSKVSEDYFPYRLRQDPGPDNALGTMKFMFPNKYAIYLHDSPHRELFNRHDRAFSSGCIRVQDPQFLASYVMGDSSEKGRDRIKKLLASGKNQALRLPKKIPIYLVYTTAWVDRNGNLNFRKDIYDRDKQMLAAICKNSHKKCEKAQISY